MPRGFSTKERLGEGEGGGVGGWGEGEGGCRRRVAG